MSVSGGLGGRILLGCAVWATACGAAASDRILLFPGGSTAEGRRAAVEHLGGKLELDLGLIDGAAAGFPDETLPYALAARELGVGMQDDGAFTVQVVDEAAWPGIDRFLAKPAAAPGAAELSRRSGPVGRAGGAEVQWGVARVGAPAVWGRLDGRGVRVAVLDTGVDRRHPDLAGNYRGGLNLVQPGLEPDDDNGHGTHVSGIIAAVRDGKGVAGVAPRAELYAVKVADAEGSARESRIIKGLEWCVENGIQVANLSLGSMRYTQALRRAVEAAARAGVTLVCAAGNNHGAVVYPAAYPESIAVTAGDAQDRLKPSSSRGPEVDFIAPGDRILSTYRGGRWEVLSGTSEAAPHVAGLAALAIQAGARSPAEVSGALSRAARPLPGLVPEEQGAGLIDAARLAGATAP